MIKACTVTTPKGDSVTIELGNPGSSGFLIRSIDGLGPTKSNIRVSESIYSDGGTFNSSRHTERNLVFNIEFFETPTETIEDLRYKSYKYFPTNTPLTITIESDTKVGTITGYVESNEPDVFSSKESTQISIICPEPFFISNEYVESIFTGIAGGFEFPLENPSTTQNLIEFGTVLIGTSTNVFYEGEVRTGITVQIKFNGAVTDPIVHNLTDSQDMKLLSSKMPAIAGSNFQNGDIVYINTLPGAKQVYMLRGSTWYNILNALDVLSDWFTISPGDNVYSYNAAAGKSNMEVIIYHNDLYGGM